MFDLWSRRFIIHSLLHAFFRRIRWSRAPGHSLLVPWLPGQAPCLPRPLRSALRPLPWPIDLAPLACGSRDTAPRGRSPIPFQARPALFGAAPGLWRADRLPVPCAAFLLPTFTHSPSGLHPGCFSMRDRPCHGHTYRRGPRAASSAECDATPIRAPKRRDPIPMI